MEYTKLGNTDIEVSKLCIGCMSFGKAGIMHDWTLDEAESEKVIKHALDLGINFFDTANCYSDVCRKKQSIGKLTVRYEDLERIILTYTSSIALILTHRSRRRWRH